MAERTDLPKIKPNETPSMFNHSMGVGGWLGAVAGGVPAYMLAARGKVKAAVGVGIASQLVGAIWGGASEKKKTEQELETGRVVKDPGYWNKGILSGLFVGGLITMPFSLLGRPLSILGTALIGTTTAVIGSMMRKSSLQKDFDRSVAARESQIQEMAAHARTQEIVQGNSGPAKTSFKNSVSPEESAALAAKQAAHGSHADKAAATPNVAAAR